MYVSLHKLLAIKSGGLILLEKNANYFRALF